MKFLLILLLCMSYSTQQERCGEDGVKHCLLTNECYQDTDCRAYADGCINRHCVPKPCKEKCAHMYECRHGGCSRCGPSGNSRNSFECNFDFDCCAGYQCKQNKCINDNK